jgi:hypothetical protein
MFIIRFDLRSQLQVPFPWERGWGEAVQITNYAEQKFGRFYEGRKSLLKSL